jgi:hypothetical protein
VEPLGAVGDPEAEDRHRQLQDQQHDCVSALVGVALEDHVEPRVDDEQRAES